MAILRVLFRRGTSCRLRLLALANVFAFCFVVVMTLMTSAVGYFVVVPYLFAEDDATLQAHRAVIAYLFVNVIGNFLICILTDTSVARAERGVKVKPRGTGHNSGSKSRRGGKGQRSTLGSESTTASKMGDGSVSETHDPSMNTHGKSSSLGTSTTDSSSRGICSTKETNQTPTTPTVFACKERTDIVSDPRKTHYLVHGMDDSSDTRGSSESVGQVKDGSDCDLHFDAPAYSSANDRHDRDTRGTEPLPFMPVVERGDGLFSDADTASNDPSKSKHERSSDVQTDPTSRPASQSGTNKPLLSRTQGPSSVTAVVDTHLDKPDPAHTGDSNALDKNGDTSQKPRSEQSSTNNDADVSSLKTNTSDNTRASHLDKQDPTHTDESALEKEKKTPENSNSERSSTTADAVSSPETSTRDAKNAASEDAWKSKEGPERSHYCVLCEKTILRRDHHCFFMTVCIGYHNHKHFIFFCLYMMVGTFYGVVLIAKFLNVVYGVKFWGPQTFLFLLVKVVDNLLRHHVIPSPFFVFLLYELYACLIVGLVACGFFYWHIVISVSGQTTHDATHKGRDYSRGARANIRDVFGHCWPLLFLLPLPLPQTHDGAHYSAVAASANASGTKSSGKASARTGKVSGKDGASSRGGKTRTENGGKTSEEIHAAQRGSKGSGKSGKVRKRKR